jgi:hypothetical protein
VVLACLLKNNCRSVHRPVYIVVVVVIVVVWMMKKGGVSQISIFNTHNSHTNLTSRHALSSCLDRIVTEVSVVDAPQSRSRSRYTNERSEINDT